MVMQVVKQSMYQELNSCPRIVNFVGLLVQLRQYHANYMGSDHRVYFKVYLTVRRPISFFL